MDPFNVLISSAGRRVGLAGILRETLGDLGLSGRILAVDASRLAAALHAVDRAWLVPRCDDPRFIPRVLEICREQGVRLVVPTIDTELPFYASRRSEFLSHGITVAVSSPEVIAVSNDKVIAHAWLAERGFPTVRQGSPDEVIAAGSVAWPCPLIVKPRAGSASKGVRRIENGRELEELAGRTDYVVQTIAPGEEYTIDVLVDRRGQCLCAVPRKRLEVRGGEVSKAVTRRHGELIDLATRLAESLPGAYGVLNIQVFWDEETRSANVIEINARVGGGFPLTWQAGGRYPQWMIEEILGRPVTAAADQWHDGLLMLRFDEAVYVRAA
jgi:carbamoyl-phosphate synthase large subunit